MNRDSTARTGLFRHIWIAETSIGKHQQLRGRSARPRPAAVSRSLLHGMAPCRPLRSRRLLGRGPGPRSPQMLSSYTGPSACRYAPHIPCSQPRANARARSVRRHRWRRLFCSMRSQGAAELRARACGSAVALSFDQRQIRAARPRSSSSTSMWRWITSSSWLSPRLMLQAMTAATTGPVTVDMLLLGVPPCMLTIR